jgi:ATP-dependent RNA helicase DeaD
MLDMGFREDIERVLGATPEDCQKVCFSATIPRPIAELVKKYLNEPEFVKIAQKEVTVPNVEQIYHEVRQQQKGPALSLVLDSQDFNKGIVFCSTKRGVDELTTQLLARGYQADALHGNLSQGQRDRVMQRFRSGAADLLVATDVAARGLDIDDVDLIINYDIPLDVENYVHRIGRTGRAGRSGKALTFVTPREGYKLRDIARYTRAQITRSELPSRRAVNELKMERIMEDVRENVAAHIKETQESKKMDRFALMLDPLFDSGMPPREVAAALLKMIMNKDLGAEEPEIEPVAQRYERPEKGGKPGFRQKGAAPRFPGKGKARRPMERLFINVGSKFKVTPRDIMGAITGETGLPGRIIGNIDIYERFTFVEVPREHAEEIMRIMSKATIRGARIAVDIAKPQD